MASAGHGGAREGAGRPAGSSGPPPAARISLLEEQARHEMLKADQRELAIERERGNLLPRPPIREASATALAVLAQSIRSIPDNLERRFSLSPDVLEAIQAEHDAALEQVALAFKAMSDDA